ncbi:MAG TPA: DsrE/DsrF/DrsH-like family protein [Candidatus Nanopelagicales bacterium]|nr:DsrE/DsrF/DrsH-like family protein [Candidatus Nanopelagicales bacterium]
MIAEAAQGATVERAEGAKAEEPWREVMRRLDALEGKVASSATSTAEDRLNLIVFSGSLDRMLAAFVLATGAAASGMEVDMFFTFWGLAALRDEKKRAKKDLIGRMFGWMLPKGMRDLPMSQMHMGGAGPAMIRAIMTKKRFASLDEMLATCAEFGVKIYACDMSREIMGIKPEELIDYPHLHYCGVATFLERAAAGRVSMFI